MPKITSIKLRDDHTEIEFLETKQTQTVTSLLKDAMTPAPEFVANFAALKTLANEICDGHLINFKSYKVTQIWFKENQQGAAGCMLHIEIKLETNTRPLHFNTPVKYALSEEQEASEFYLEGTSIDLLKKLEQNALDFMHGVRAQAELNFSEKTEEPQETKNAESKPRKNRKTCMDCNDPSAMVIDGQGYCKKHGKQHLID